MPDSSITNSQQVPVTKAHGFVVVSWWQRSSSDGRTGSFEYTFRRTLNDALEAYKEYQDGEYRSAEAMGMFACDAAGMPLHKLDPELLIRLMRETRAA